MEPLYRLLIYFTKSLLNFHKQAEKKNVYIFSTPRSGSTLLMELIACQPGFKYFDEPLNLRREDVRRTGFFNSWESLMPEGANEERVLKYFKMLEDNKLKFMNPPPIVRRNHRFFTNRIVFKIHEMEHMINIIRDRLNGRIIFLLRHPIATTISRHVFPRLQFFVESEYYKNQVLTPQQLRIINRIYKNGKEFEKGILSWCYQNVIPLNHLDNESWIIMTYEELLLNSDKSCMLLYETLDLGRLDRLTRMVRKTASNINLSDQETLNIMSDYDEDRRKKRIVTKWKNKVSTYQEKIAFEILAAFNIDAYCKNHFIASDKYLNFADTRDKIQEIGLDEFVR